MRWHQNLPLSQVRTTVYKDTASTSQHLYSVYCNLCGRVKKSVLVSYSCQSKKWSVCVSVLQDNLVINSGKSTFSETVVAYSKEIQVHSNFWPKKVGRKSCDFVPFDPQKMLFINENAHIARPKTKILTKHFKFFVIKVNNFIR